MDCSQPGSAVHGISQWGILKRVAISSSRGSSQSRGLSSHWQLFFTTKSAGKLKYYIVFLVVQSLSHVWLFVTPWTEAHQASLSFTISWSLLKLLSIEFMMPSNHLTLSPPFPPALNLSQHPRVFSISSLHQVDHKYSPQNSRKLQKTNIEFATHT